MKFITAAAAFASAVGGETSAAAPGGPLCSSAGITPNPASVMPRTPLEEFVETDSLVAALRRGVAEMKKRKPSDPRSWFFQAAIHGVQLDETDFGYKYYKAAAATDADVAKIDRKFWNQCPHFGQNSANFLPWHRAYTFHFEQILREHTGDSNFSLPYWNYESNSNRKFPKIFGIEHLDQNPDNINPLFMKERDFYLTYYEHPLIPNMPLLELTDAVVDSSQALASEVFFGATEATGLAGGIADDEPSTRGLLESRPHDHIHRVIGGVIPGGAVIKDKDGKDVEVDVVGAMATPPTAGFDPIFSLHHTNIDRLWVEWSYMPGKQWGKLPLTSWFLERPWFFFDAEGNCVNEPRLAYFDHRKLGVRFKYENPNATPLTLPEFPTAALAAGQSLRQQSKQLSQLAATETPVAIGTAFNTALALPPPMNRGLIRSLRAVRPSALAQPSQQRIVLRLTITDINKLPTVGFDVHVTANPNDELLRTSASFVGSINLFVHAHHGNEVVQDFDITSAIGSVGDANLAAMKVVFVPVALTRSIRSGAPNLQSDPLRVRRIEFFTVGL